MNVKLLLTLTAILLSHFIFSQNIELDKRGGFKTIKIGESLENFVGFKKTEEAHGMFRGSWIPSDDDLGYLFNIKINGFELQFDSATNKLIKMIAVISRVKKTGPEDYDFADKFISTFKSLNAVLGNADSCNQEEMYCWWYGKKIAMKWSYEEKSKISKNGDRYEIEVLRLTYLDMPYFKNKLNKGF